LEEFRETWKTRYDYQVLLNVSKATAARRLRKWVREKKVARRGIGKSSLYKMEAGLLPLLAKKRGSP
jgi:Fic family protein